jgi:hypothetical protein
MNRFVKAFGFAFVLMFSVALAPGAFAQASTTTTNPPGTVTPEKARWVLDACAADMYLQIGATRNDLNIAYASGKLTIDPTVKPNYVMYDVSLGGITLCVIENI